MPLNILLADDSVPAQNMGKKILVDAGYHVQTVSNGLEALRRIAEFTPDIVIMDIFMPGYTGLEVCERLRASDATVALPVILTVGKLEPYRPEDGEHVHANAVIVKPFAADELIAAVRSLIGVPPVEEVIAAPAPEPFQAAVLDDQPFYCGELAIPEDAAPWASQEPNFDDTELLLSNLDLDGPKSLVFNPDAGPTPFSASVIDLLPAESHFPPEDEVSAFTEFDPGPEASHDLSAPELKTSATEEFSAASADVEIGIGAATVLLASEPQISTALSAVAFDESISGWLAPVELESPTRDVPALDPWLEVQTKRSVPTILDLDEPAEEIPSEVAPGSAAETEVASTSHAAPPAQDEDEEARRQAFEELFNSTEPFPVEQSYAPSAGVSCAMPPAMADLSKDVSGHVTSDSQTESLLDREDGFIDPELDPYLMNQEEPVSAALRIPDRNLLSEDLLETDWPDSQSAQEPTQAAMTNSGDLPNDLPPNDLPDDTDWPQPKEPSEPMPRSSREAEFTEAQLEAAEPFPVAPETLDQWAPPAVSDLAEIVEPTAVAVAQQETVSGMVHPGAQPGSPEPMQSGPELHVDEPAPVEEPEPQPAPVEEPEPEPRPAPVPQSELAEPQFDIPVAEISSYPVLPPQSDEAERVQQAVDRVFDRFKRLLVAAIVRELARQD